MSDTSLLPYKISIHALVKRATLALKDTSKKYVYFNPRPREEGDRGRKVSAFYLRNFNPRPREEGDKKRLC